MGNIMKGIISVRHVKAADVAVNGYRSSVSTCFYSILGKEDDTTESVNVRMDGPTRKKFICKIPKSIFVEFLLSQGLLDGMDSIKRILHEIDFANVVFSNSPLKNEYYLSYSISIDERMYKSLMLLEHEMMMGSEQVLHVGEDAKIVSKYKFDIKKLDVSAYKYYT